MAGMIGAPGASGRTHDELSIMGDMMAAFRAAISNPKAADKMLKDLVKARDEANAARDGAAERERAAQEAIEKASGVIATAEAKIAKADARIEAAKETETASQNRIDAARRVLEEKEQAHEIAAARDRNAHNERERRLTTSENAIKINQAGIEVKAKANTDLQAALVTREAKAEEVIADYEARLRSLVNLATGAAKPAKSRKRASSRKGALA